MDRIWNQLPKNFMMLPNSPVQLGQLIVPTLKFFLQVRLNSVFKLDHEIYNSSFIGGENAEYFRNRKGFFSLNVQVIGDPELYIRDIVARWPGSTHDQTIFSNSYIRSRFESGEFGNSVLIGDSGYSVRNYMMTPIHSPRSDGERLFNEAHVRSRNCIERLFGVWKRRFPVLALGIRLKLETTKSLIEACAVLHNIAVEMREAYPIDDPTLSYELEEIPETNIVNTEPHNVREQFVLYFFNLSQLN